MLSLGIWKGDAREDRTQGLKKWGELRGILNEFLDCLVKMVPDFFFFLTKTPLRIPKANLCISH